MDDSWDWIVGIAIIVLIGWGGAAAWNWIFPDSNSNYENSYGQPTGIIFSDEDCVEPENPYDFDSGHYAGWEWGAEGNYCSGNSTSFVEGCEEYQAAEDEYEQCLQ